MENLKKLSNKERGIMELFFYPFMPAMGIDYLDMKCLSVYDGDKCIFTYEDFTKEAYHSEPVGINAVQASNSSVPLFDLQGRRIQGEPRKGMYVLGGKKYVKK